MTEHNTNTDSKRINQRKDPIRLDDIITFHNPQGHNVAQAVARVATNSNVDVYMGKIINPVHVLAGRIIDGWESPHWLGLEGEYREIRDGAEPVKIEGKDKIARIYDIAEQEWKHIQSAPNQQETKSDILAQIDPMLLEEHDIVIKHIRPTENPEHADYRLSRETGPMQQIAFPHNHDNLIRYFGAMHDPELGHYLLMEYVPGKTLQEFLINPQTNNRLAPEASVDIIEKVLMGTMHLHGRKLIHRDLKPANIVMREPDENPIILDLGVSKNLLDHVTMQGATVGTLSYMSPEQYVESGEVDERADIYALGTILVEMLTGHQAYPILKGMTKEQIGAAITARNHPWSVNKFLPDIHPELEALVEGSRAKFVDDRFTPPQMLRQIKLVKEHKAYFAKGDRTLEDSSSLGTKHDRLDLTRKKLRVKVDRLGMHKLYRQLEEQLNAVGKLVEANNYAEAQIALEQAKKGLQHYAGDGGKLHKLVNDYGDAIKSNSQYARLNSLFSMAKRATERKDYVDLSDRLVLVEKELRQLPEDKHPAAHQDYAALTAQLEPHKDYVDLFKTARKNVESTEKDMEALVKLDAEKKPVDAIKLAQLPKRLKTAKSALDLVPEETTPQYSTLLTRLTELTTAYDAFAQKYAKH